MVPFFRRALPKGHRWTTRGVIMLGVSLLAQRKYAEAEPLLSEGYPAMKADSVKRVVELYERWGKTNKAAEWREKLLAVSNPSPGP